ncbi:Phospholipase abhd3 [Perkinsus chesapeaki]|uniref:Phospholipase abhd3 n=1 Tax=Perkinsus chesapeaki TaxID=330153 RepID=A0A7J6M638_PERCH|nr:Phospholipase abhd3 [Perkinsus chesapeaki]
MAPSSPRLTSPSPTGLPTTTSTVEFSSVPVGVFWESVCRGTHDEPHVPTPTVHKTPPPPSTWVVVSLVVLVLEASRHIVLPMAFILPISLDLPRYYTLLICTTVIIILLITKYRYKIHIEEAKPGVHANTGGKDSDFGKVIHSLLGSRLKAYEPSPLFSIGGHWATAILFLTTTKPSLSPCRRWMMTSDKQSIALDWFMPPTDDVEGVLLVLHGLNGSSTEQYLTDLYHTALPHGYAICCMIARGLGGTPIVGDHKDSFSGARVSDARTAVNICHNITKGRVPLTLVGYSMGGVIATNMVAKYGHELKGQLNACVSISGGIRLWEKVDNKVSRELWQPLLAFELKQGVLGPMVRRTGFTPEDPNWYDKPSDLFHVDGLIPAAAHGYDDVIDYYHDMSACSDRYSNGGSDIAVPTLIVHSLDDPIIHVDAGAAIPSTASKYLFALITKTGGHVGWPQGWTPWEKGFHWVSETVLQFSQTVSQNWHLVESH